MRVLGMEEWDAAITADCFVGMGRTRDCQDFRVRENCQDFRVWAGG